MLEENNFEGLARLDKRIRASKSIEELIVNSLMNTVPLIISLEIIEDPDEPAKKKVPIIEQPWFSLGRSDLVANETDVKAKKNREAHFKRISALLKLFNPEAEDTDSVARKILDLEVELAKISVKSEERRDLNKLLRKFAKTSLSAVAPGFDLALVTDSILGDKTVEQVIVVDVEYFQSLSRVLQGKEDVAKDMMTFNLINHYGWLVSDKFYDIAFEFWKVKNGLKKKPQQKDDVYWWLIGKMPNVMGRLYIDTVGFDQKDRERAEKMVADIKKSMAKMIDEKDWMDQATKSAAKEKLDKMRAHIAFAEWIKNDTELTKYLDIEFNQSDGPFELAWNLNKFKSDDEIRKINEPVDPKHEWTMSPAEMDARYNILQNLMLLPAAILRDVFFSADLPDYLNYGSIGTVIGHEITHGFDDEGRQMGHDGRLFNWWSNETLKNFKKASEKIVHQYGSIVDERTKLNLNGINTQGENIADNGGLKAAFLAYVEQAVNEAALPGFEGESADRMFFLSFANCWCAVINDQSLRNYILYDSHSPPRYRVNVPLSNLEAFAKAFKCSPGSKMNPKDKVSVW